MQGRSKVGTAKKACNLHLGPPQHPLSGAQLGMVMHGMACAPRSHCTAPEHKAKALGKSKPTGGRRPTPSGMSAEHQEDLASTLETLHEAGTSMTTKAYAYVQGLADIAAMHAA